jgi:hypothetical protein
VVGDLKPARQPGQGVVLSCRGAMIKAGKRERPCTHGRGQAEASPHLESSWAPLILTPISERFVGLSFANQQEKTGPS